MSSNKKEALTLQMYDYKQMFDAINLEQATSDVFDVGVNDDNLVMIYNANKDVKMAVNTPNGLTERQTLKNFVLQRDTFGSILASVQVDSIGKEVEETDFVHEHLTHWHAWFGGRPDWCDPCRVQGSADECHAQCQDSRETTPIWG